MHTDDSKLEMSCLVPLCYLKSVLPEDASVHFFISSSGSVGCDNQILSAVKCRVQTTGLFTAPLKPYPLILHKTDTHTLRKEKEAAQALVRWV